MDNVDEMIRQALALRPKQKAIYDFSNFLQMSSKKSYMKELQSSGSRRYWSRSDCIGIEAYMGKLRLKTGTPQEVRRTLSRVINLVANGEMDSKTGNTIIVGCNAVLNSIRTDDYEKKINELADLLEEVVKAYEKH